MKKQLIKAEDLMEMQPHKKRLEKFEIEEKIKIKPRSTPNITYTYVDQDSKKEIVNVEQMVRLSTRYKRNNKTIFKKKEEVRMYASSDKGKVTSAFFEKDPFNYRSVFDWYRTKMISIILWPSILAIPFFMAVAESWNLYVGLGGFFFTSIAVGLLVLAGLLLIFAGTAVAYVVKMANRNPDDASAPAAITEKLQGFDFALSYIILTQQAAKLAKEQIEKGLWDREFSDVTDLRFGGKLKLNNVEFINNRIEIDCDLLFNTLVDHGKKVKVEKQWVNMVIAEKVEGTTAGWEILKMVKETL